MGVNVAKLKSNPRGLNEIFFSGSQSVTKGDEVIWVLDDTFAFQATEDCKVSTNASPFVEISAGDIFIIYKRTDEDIKDNNSKGIYVFDRDTIVRLAYPQETTQDIVIENDNYNNNLNTIIVEADKTPVAKIDVSNAQPYINETITVSGASSYAISPANIASYKWTKNGVHVSSSLAFSYKNTSVRQDDITLVITDSDGKKANTSSVVNWQKIPSEPPSGGGGVDVPPPLNNIVVSKTFNTTFGLTDGSAIEIGRFILGKNGTGNVRLTASVPLWTMTNKDGNHTVYLSVSINGVNKADTSLSIPPSNQGFIISLNKDIGALSLREGDVISLHLRDANGDPRVGYTITDNNGNQQLQVSITNRTA